MRVQPMAFSLIAGMVLIGGAVAGYFWLFRRPNPPLPENELQVGPATFTVELATSSVAQARGLSYRPSLADGQGMLFLFGRPAVQRFWMKDMNFPLDIVWIGSKAALPNDVTLSADAAGADEVVLGFAENAAPQPGVALWSLKIYASPPGVDKVLEVNAGTVAKENIKVGDPVRVGPGQ